MCGTAHFRQTWPTNEQLLSVLQASKASKQGRMFGLMRIGAGAGAGARRVLRGVPGRARTSVFGRRKSDNTANSSSEGKAPKEEGKQPNRTFSRLWCAHPQFWPLVPNLRPCLFVCLVCLFACLVCLPRRPLFLLRPLFSSSTTHSTHSTHSTASFAC